MSERAPTRAIMSERHSWHGTAQPSAARHGLEPQARRGTGRRGTARHGTAGRKPLARHGTVRHGTAWNPRHGAARHETTRHGTARRILVRHGTWRGAARGHPGTARRDRHGTAWRPPGTARSGGVVPSPPFPHTPRSFPHPLETRPLNEALAVQCGALPPTPPLPRPSLIPHAPPSYVGGGGFRGPGG